MKFTDTLKELEAKATEGPWCGRLLIEITEADSDLCDYLRNHAKEIINLVEAAEKYHGKGGSTYGEREIVEALAAFKEQS